MNIKLIKETVLKENKNVKFFTLTIYRNSKGDTFSISVNSLKKDYKSF